MLQRLDNFRGLTLQALDGELGRIDDFRFDHQRWTVRYLVVETGSWFGRHVLVSPISTGQPDWVEDRLDVRLTRDQIRNSPEVPAGKPIDRETEAAYAAYYGYPPYWGGPRLWGSAAAPRELGGPPPADYTPPPERMHLAGRALRSLHALRGQHVHARDGDIGHVDDGVIDDETWHIAYLLVDTSNWIGGLHVLVPTALVRDVEWTKGLVIDATRDLIQSGPRCDPALPLDRTISDALERHYRPTTAGRAASMRGGGVVG
jgi:uncharacterized protein YrrD